MNSDFQKITDYYESQRLEKQLIINKWNRKAGKPHSTLKTQDGVILGFWHTNDGIIQIPANVRGEYDPHKALLIDKQELKAIQQALSHKPTELS